MTEVMGGNCCMRRHDRCLSCSAVPKECCLRQRRRQSCDVRHRQRYPSDLILRPLRTPGCERRHTGCQRGTPQSSTGWVQILCWAAGGPQTYTGKDMRVRTGTSISRPASGTLSWTTWIQTLDKFRCRRRAGGGRRHRAEHLRRHRHGLNWPRRRGGHHGTDRHARDGLSLSREEHGGRGGRRGLRRLLGSHGRPCLCLRREPGRAAFPGSPAASRRT